MFPSLAQGLPTFYILGPTPLIEARYDTIVCCLCYKTVWSNFCLCNINKYPVALDFGSNYKASIKYLTKNGLNLNLNLRQNKKAEMFYKLAYKKPDTRQKRPLSNLVCVL